MKKTTIIGLLLVIVCGAYGNAAKLIPPKVTMAMWDFSWLRGHYPGGPFEDWGKALDEAKERGFNTVRIEAFPLLIDDLHQQGKQSILVPAKPHETWGWSTKDVEHNVADELVEFMEITKEKGVYVILSTWNDLVDRTKYTKREDYWRAWELVLDMLDAKGLLSHVLYVDFDQEFPYFSPFNAQLGAPPSAGDSASDMENAGSTVGTWNGDQRAFVKDYFESTLAHFNKKYPDMRFTFSMTTHWKEARSLNLKGMGVLELHFWIEGQLDKYTGFNSMPKTRNPEIDYKEYMAKVNDAMKNHKEDFKADMKAQLELATAWADELGVPLTTSEAWGPWWHMDHPDLEWQWLYDWCEYGMGLSGDYGFWGSTPWNYAHPYWKNWDNIEWYQRVNYDFLGQKIPENPARHSAVGNQGTLNLLEPAVRENLDKYNVVWESPSQDEKGSMPIGNGDLASNFWVEPNGDIVFYLSKSDAWSGASEEHELLKVGRLCIRSDQPLFQEGDAYKQELDLATGAIRIKTKLATLVFWIDANRNVVNVEIESSKAFGAEVTLETWRTPEADRWGGAQADTVLPSEGNTIRWYHRNTQSIFADSLQVQHLGEFVDDYEDPLINRTFGGLVSGEGLESSEAGTLVTKAPTKKLHLRVHALTAQTATPEEWVDRIEQQRAAADGVALEEARTAHEAWWADFWSRSYIFVSGTPEAETVTRAYVLQRWVQAGAGRGEFPIKFNGSLFTVDETEWGPDYRRWGGCYWFQNTRLSYWPMLYSGDLDQMEPLWKMYREALPLLKDRTKKYYGHDGVFMSETMYPWGLNRIIDFGRGTEGFEPHNYWIRYYWDSGNELTMMMLDRYAQSPDEDFASSTLIPIADEVVKFYDQHHSRNAEGKVHFSPAMSLETWHTAEDPLPVIIGLQTVLTRLLNLPDTLTSPEQRARWARFRSELPGIPFGEEAGKRWIKPARTYSDPKNWENPELYAVFPYRAYTVGKPDLEVALETWQRRLNKGTGCWRQDAIQAAVLGLTAEAKGYVVQNATPMPSTRFPAFWGPNFDWTPDQDHAGVTMIALQRMLMQIDGDTIRLLPAWPKDWNVDFKLHAPHNTTVEGRVEDGKVIKGKITPKSRRKDIVITGLANAQDQDAALITPPPSTEPTPLHQAMIDRKYGMFIHYGINTFHDTEWTDGTMPASSYNPTAVDTDNWAKTARDAGMKYVILVTKHHEGFSLWDSKYTEYDVASSPNKTDVVASMAKSCEKYGIKLGLYYSLWDRNWGDGVMRHNGNLTPEQKKAYVDYMANQLTELLTNYGDICELWLDGGWVFPQCEDWQIPRIYDLVKTLQPDCAMSSNWTIGDPDKPEFHAVKPPQYKEGYPIQYFPSDFRLGDPELPVNPDPKLYGHDGELYYLPFEATVCMNQYWFYNTADTTVKSVEELARVYGIATAQDNILILNSPPNRDGRMPEANIERLKELATHLGLGHE